MGPYMSPIPINASMGMLISLAVAFVVTPWLSHKLLRHKGGEGHSDNASPVMLRLFTRLIKPFLESRKARLGMAAGVFVLIGMAVALPVGQLVVLKMLPFDNKSEFQVMVDMPEGTPVEQTEKVLKALSDYLMTVRSAASAALCRHPCPDQLQRPGQALLCPQQSGAWRYSGQSQ